MRRWAHSTETRRARGAFWAVSTLGLLAVVVGPALGGDEPSASDVPAALARFDYLIGRWRGTAVPAANRVRGWRETHAWAWKFAKGKPVGLSVTLDGNMTLASAQLTHDAATQRYTLQGAGPDGKPVTFAGSLDATGKQLVLDRVGSTAAGARQRITLYPNANFIRYTLRLGEQAPGAPQFKPAIEVGLTREGEAFAATGGGAADLPKCIVTGGAATLTVSYKGKSFPLCCTGCRDEFNDNPEKYLAKAAAMAAAAGSSGGTAKPAASSKDDGSFDGLIDEPKTPRSPTDAPAAKTKASPVDSLLKQGQELERAGKKADALVIYRRIVKDHPESAAAATAAARARALSGR